MQFAQIEIKHLVGLALQRLAQDVGGDEGIAVAVAANPAADLHKGRQFGIGPARVVLRQHGFQRRIQLRQLGQDRVIEERQAIFHLVHHRQLGGTQEAGLPQGDDAAAERLFIVGGFLGRHLVAVALVQQARDRHLAIQDALALHLGRMRGKHRADEGIVEKAGQGVGLIGRKHIAQRIRQTPLARRRTGDQMGAGAADMVLVFGNVGQQREITEGAYQLRGFFLRQRLQRIGQLAARSFVIVASETDCQLTHIFNAFERGVAQMAADRIAQQAPQLTDIAAEQLVFHFIHRLHVYHNVYHVKGASLRSRAAIVSRALHPPAGTWLKSPYRRGAPKRHRADPCLGRSAAI